MGRARPLLAHYARGKGKWASGISGMVLSQTCMMLEIDVVERNLYLARRVAKGPTAVTTATYYNRYGGQSHN
jgi:hypothetical protein